MKLTRSVREGIDEHEFGRQCVELIEVINSAHGPGSAAARALAEAVPGMARELPAATRADLFDAQRSAPEPVEDDDGWSNLGPGMSEPECVTDDPEPEVVDVEIVEPEPEAVVVALPGCQRCIPASEVLDSDGVPIPRSRRGYDPLRGWVRW